ncbi:MAG: isoquinoline 1-oxidoreductase, partial [Marivirga sp.]|nr:isoquinoline 1-oxidoreductase [Marivirga sp.]
MKTLDSTSSQQAIVRNIDRRTFLKVSGMSVTGLILGVQFGCSRSASGIEGTPFSPNAYLTVNSDGSVIIVAHRSEMGTGIRTGLPLIIADELEADWKKVKVIQAVGDESKYGNQNTDGSFSVRMFFEPMRKAGATARMMLEAAAAKQWGVPAAECKAVNHEVVHGPSGKKVGFGSLTTDASKIELPKEETLVYKKKSDWKYIGKSTSIVDVHNIVNGTAVYGLDTILPGIKYATVLRCPVAGGKVKSFNSDKAKKFPGVLQILEIESKGFPSDFPNPLGGIVIVADNTWAAISARKEIEVEWDLGSNASYSTNDYFKDMSSKVKKKGKVRRQQGSIDTAIKDAAHVIESTYMIPHLAHASMETPCAVAQVKNGKCEIWAPVQHPQWARGSVAKALNIEEANVTVNVTLLGGGFGRKSKPDYVVEAALVSQMSGLP